MRFEKIAMNEDVKTLAKGSAWVGAAIVASLFLEYLFQYSIARQSVTEFGLFGVVYGLHAVLSALTITGLVLNFVKDKAENSLSHAFSTMLSINALFFIALVAWSLLTKGLSKYLFWAAPIIVTFPLVMLARAVFQKNKDYKKYAWITLIEAVAKTVFTLAFFHYGFQAYYALIAFLIADLLTLAIAFQWIKEKIVFKPDFQTLKESWKATIALTSIMFFLRADVALVINQAGSTIAGHYNAATMFSRTLVPALAAISITAFPFLAENKKKVYKTGLYKTGLIATLAIGIIAAMVFALIKTPVFELLLPEYTAMQQTAVILLFGASLLAGVNYVIQSRIATHLSSKDLVKLLAADFLLVVATILILPNYPIEVLEFAWSAIAFLLLASLKIK